jgi:hypothetical protein
MKRRFAFLVSFAAVFPAGTHAQPAGGAIEGTGYFKGIRGDYTATQERWWKGNTHTHSWWSDGDSAPEIAAAWYREHGYDFVVLSDHNIMQKGGLRRGDVVQMPTFWYAIEREGRAEALATYRRHFGPDWVETRIRGGITEVRLKTLDEFRHLFEAPGEFIFVPGEEITASFEDHPVHMNGINLQDVIAPRTGRSVADVVQNNLNAVLDHGVASGREVIAHLNHPNFQYAVTVEDLVALDHAAGEGFFEVYNGHNAVENYGDAARVGTERMWDIVLAQRLGRYGRALLYGIANDDAHHFALWEPEQRSNPGRGWIMVRALRLTPDFIVAAMKRGDFYNSTGVVLRELVRDGKTLSLAVEPESGVDYTIEFVGTRSNADLAARPAHRALPEPTGRISDGYSTEIGVVLHSVRGTQARYELKGDELYVRARVTSTAPHPHGHRAADVQMAWTQPLVPGSTGH